MKSDLLDTFRAYAQAARYLAQEPGRTWLGSFLKLAWVRTRYGMNAENLAFFALDGKWPKSPGDYVHGRVQVNAFLKEMNPVQSYAEVDDKVVFYRRCLRSSIPTAAIITAVTASSTQRACQAPESISICHTAAELGLQLSSVQITEFFCKPAGGINGKGGFALTRTEHGFFSGGESVSIDTLFHRIQTEANRYGTMILQERLRLHCEMLRISPSGALSTVRVVTCLENGAVRIVAALLKICVGDNETDNFAKGLTGNLVANVDLETGRLAKAIGSASREFPVMRSYATHPDNGHRIEGFELPKWNDLRELVIRAHHEFSEFWTLGWDIALTDKGPVVIETNPIWATGFVQVAAGKGMRHEFDRWRAELQHRRTA